MSTEVVVYIAENNTKYTKRIPFSKDSLIVNLNDKSNTNKANSQYKRPNYRVFKDEFDDSDSDSSLEDSVFNEEEIIDESLSDKEEPEEGNLAPKSSRRQNLSISLNFDPLDKRKKKQKRELTEEEIIKKNDLLMQRKKQLKEQQEEEKRLAIDRILNDEGKKLRDRKKNLENKAKIEQEKEERNKANLSKIQVKYCKDGQVTVRFPQGLLIPKVLYQKPPSEIPKNCEIENCLGMKRYRDPKSGIYYCSLDCYKKIKA